MLPLLPIIGLIGSALAIGAVIYLAVKLTISFLKKYKQKKNSKVMAAQVKDLMKNAPTMSLDDLDDDDVVLAEYDEDEDELVQDISISKDNDEKVSRILKNNGGIVVFEWWKYMFIFRRVKYQKLMMSIM